MIDQFEILDLYKALLALAAGVILGLERELKDKAAGLKTISVITLGSALFAIISYKVGSPFNEPTRIASYVVSGIGFLGAGVIFKDGVNVSGLTTASVIWLASAVGMSIGFGEVYLAAIFLGISLVIIYLGNIINTFFPGARLSRMLSIVIPKKQYEKRNEVIQSIGSLVERYEERKVQADEQAITIVLNIIVEKDNIKLLEEYLVKSECISSFEL